MNLFQKFTLRIVLFFLKKSKNWTLFFSMWPKELNFFQFDSKNCLLLRNITRWIESFFFFNITQRLEPFSHNMTFKNWTFLKNMTQRIELFKCDLEPRIILQFDSNNWIWLKALNPPFQYDSKNWTLFWTWLTETFLSYNNSKNCFVKKYDSQNVKNWTFFSQMTRRLDFSFSNMSDRNNFFFLKKRWLEELIFWKYQSNCTKLFWWLKELSSFFFWKDMTHRNWTFFHMTQRIEPFFEDDSKNWKIFMIFWLKE